MGNEVFGESAPERSCVFVLLFWAESGPWICASQMLHHAQGSELFVFFEGASLNQQYVIFTRKLPAMSRMLLRWLSAVRSVEPILKNI